MASQLPSRRFCPSRLSFVLLLSWSLSSCLFNDGDPLQSNCVQQHFEFERTIQDGQECSNFGYADCGNDTFASECVNFCAFGVCQGSPCESDSDCAPLGDAACEDYVVSDVTYGKWCNISKSYGGSGDCDCICTCINAGGSNCSATCANSDL